MGVEREGEGWRKVGGGEKVEGLCLLIVALHYVGCYNTDLPPKVVRFVLS